MKTKVWFFEYAEHDGEDVVRWIEKVQKDPVGHHLSECAYATVNVASITDIRSGLFVVFSVYECLYKDHEHKEYWAELEAQDAS